MAKVFHIKKPGNNGTTGWVLVCDCKDQNELKAKLEEQAKRFLKGGNPATVTEVIQGDLLRVYEGASWRGIAWLKRNNICQ